MIYVVLDIETTGFSRDYDDILEVGYIRINDNCQIVSSGALYFYKPEFNVESSAQKIHGLTRSELKDYCKPEDFDTNLAKLYTLCYKSVIIGKNSNSFDIPFIRNFLFRYADGLMELKVFGTLDVQQHFEKRYQKYIADTTGYITKKKGTLEDYMRICGYSPEDVGRMYREELKTDRRARTHGALYDAFMTFKALEYGVKNYGINIKL